MKFCMLVSLLLLQGGGRGGGGGPLCRHNLFISTAHGSR